MIRFGARLVRALAALAALAGLLVGMPALLLVIAPLHLPTSWPRWTDVMDALMRPDDGHLFILALSVIAWTGWAMFALSAVLETASRLRGVPVMRLPGLGSPQRLAATLMTSTAVLLSSAATAAIPTPPRAPVATALADITPSLVADTEPAAHGTADRAPNQDPHEDLPRVTVQRGDTLWRLARHHLGHGTRYPEIAALNYGRPQPDGRTLTSAHWLRPGWILLLPADADVGTPPGTSTNETYKVRPHDTLWSIAEAQLGDPERYTEIFTLNQGRHQADGGSLTDPDTIRPGWTLRLPAPTRDAPPQLPTSPDDSAPTPGSIQTPTLPPRPGNEAAPTSTPPAATPSTSTPPAATPSTVATPEPNAAPSLMPSAATPPRTATPSRPATPSQAATPSRVEERPTPSAAAPPTVEAPGPTPSSTSPSTAPAPDATPPDAAPEASPVHRVDDDGIHLPGGFLPWPLAGALSAAAAMVWLRRRHRPGPDGDDFALPDVVETVVRDTGRRPETKPPSDLAARAAAVPPQHQPPPGGTGLVGPGAPSAARAAMVAALASGGPHEPDHRAEVTIDRDTLTRLLGERAAIFEGWPRLHLADTADHALDLVEEHLLHRARLLDDNAAPDVDTLRDQNPDEEAVPPLVLILTPGNDRLAQRTDTVLRLGAGKNVTGLLLGPYPDGPTLQVTDQGYVHLRRSSGDDLDSAPDSGVDDTDSDVDAPGGTVPTEGRERIAVLDADSAITMLQALHEAHTGHRHEPASHQTRTTAAGTTAAAAGTTTATGSSQTVKAPGFGPRRAAASSSDTVRARLRVFGHPRILDVPPEARPLRSKALELAVLLACHREGADTRTIGEHLAPDSRLRQADQLVHTLVSNLRYVLGQAADQRRNAYVVKTAGRYHLDPVTVDVDLWTMNDLLAQAAAAPDAASRVPLLRQACAQYTGPLADGRDYEWIATHRETARRTAIEAHRQLAEALLGTEARAAADVLDAAIAIDPYTEDLYQAAMHARHQAGDRDGIRRLRRALTAALEDLDTEPSDETLELAHQLTDDVP